MRDQSTSQVWSKASIHSGEQETPLAIASACHPWARTWRATGSKKAEIVGATVVTMGLLAVPTMLKRGYQKELATGTVSASGTLGQIIPPSIILILLGDVVGVPVGIALFILVMTFVSTVLYFQQSALIYDAIADRGERRALLAKMDWAVNFLTILFQVYLTARIVKWLGVGLTLAIVPVVMAAGFVALGLYPTLAVLVVVQVIYRAGRYGLTKPAREMLWTVLGREAKYKSKPFLDAAVYRGGDLVSGWIYTGLAAVGLSIGAIALVSAPVAGLWALLALRLGRREEELASKQGEKT